MLHIVLIVFACLEFSRYSFASSTTLSFISRRHNYGFAIKLCESIVDHGYTCTNDPIIKISIDRVCDGVADCENATDEKNCSECKTNARCLKNGHLVCLRMSDIINDSFNCDEGFSKSTVLREKCNEGERKCANSNLCMQADWRCDGEVQCPQGDDEQKCSHCLNGAKLCKPTSKCIPIWATCDGRRDCPDGSDEALCTHEQCIGKTAVSGGIVLMQGDDCVAVNLLCDGHKDLTSGSDEERCYHRGCFPGLDHPIVRQKVPCIENNNNLVDARYACGGADDEVGCNVECDTCFNETAFDCSIGDGVMNVTSGYRICISPAKVCDGIMHCPNGYDEFDCDCETPWKLKCLNGKCLKEEKSCDGTADCPDGADERNCSSCHAGFHCTIDKQCIMTRKVCDGREDCSDGQDELSCSCAQCHDHPFQTYYCSDEMRCYRADEVCVEGRSKCKAANINDNTFCAIRAGASFSFC